MARPAPTRPRALAGAVFLLALFTTPARAERITPDSILRPPPGGVPAVPDAVVLPQDLVTDQYQGVGVRFPVRPGVGAHFYATAITSVNGVPTWSGVISHPTDAGWIDRLNFGALAGVDGELTAPVRRLRVDFELSRPGFAFLAVRDVNGNTFFTGSHDLATHVTAAADAPGIVAFEARAIGSLVPVGAPGGRTLPADLGSPFTWGVSAVEYTGGPVATFPEPSGLTLAALGLAGLLGYARRARRGQGQWHSATSGPASSCK